VGNDEERAERGALTAAPTFKVEVKGAFYGTTASARTGPRRAGRWSQASTRRGMASGPPTGSTRSPGLEGEAARHRQRSPGVRSRAPWPGWGQGRDRPRRGVKCGAEEGLPGRWRLSCFLSVWRPVREKHPALICPAGQPRALMPRWTRFPRVLRPVPLRHPYRLALPKTRPALRGPVAAPSRQRGRS